MPLVRPLTNPYTPPLYTDVLGECDLQAVIVVSGVVGTLGYMYIAGKQTKSQTGPASIYSAFPFHVTICFALMR